MRKIYILLAALLITFLILPAAWAAVSPPFEPIDLEAVADSSAIKIRLTWDDDSDNEIGFIIERAQGGGFGQIDTVGRNATSYTDIQVFPNTEYDYRVRAYNEAGRSEPSNEASATTGITPDPPAYLEAAAISTTKVMLNWEDNSDNETGFKIERRKAGDKFSQIKTVGKNITTYTDTGLTSNTKYYYRVRAYNNLGNSTYTSESSVTMPKIESIISLVIGNTSYYVNNQLRTMDTAPIIRDNRTLLPIKYVAEAVGAAVDWNNSERKVTITLKGTVIELWIENSKSRVNGEYKPIDSSNTKVTPIIVEPGRTMLPIRFVSETLGAKVDWNSTKKEVTVTYPAP